MSAPPDIRAVMLSEYMRLQIRKASNQVVQQRMDAENDVMEKRMEALNAALKVYTGKDDPTDTTDFYIAEHYRRGWPTEFMCGTMDGIDNVDDGTWTTEHLHARAVELGVTRPIGWDEARAKAEFDATDYEDDTWLYISYGLPDPAITLDRLPAPEPPPLLLAAPEPVVNAVMDAAPVVNAPIDRPAPREDRYDRVNVAGFMISEYLAQRWTAERIEVLTRDYQTFRDLTDIIAELNTLPGETIIATHISGFARNTLKISRPDGFQSYVSKKRFVTDPAIPKRQIKDAIIADAERIMCEMWPSGDSEDDILAALYEVGSKLIRGDLPGWARSLGLSRPSREVDLKINAPEPDNQIHIVAGPESVTGIPVTEQNQEVTEPEPRGINGADTSPTTVEPETAMQSAMLAALTTKAITKADPGAIIRTSWPNIKRLALADGRALVDMHELQNYNKSREQRGLPPMFITPRKTQPHDFR